MFDPFDDPGTVTALHHCTAILTAPSPSAALRIGIPDGPGADGFSPSRSLQPNPCFAPLSFPSIDLDRVAATSTQLPKTTTSTMAGPAPGGKTVWKGNHPVGQIAAARPFYRFAATGLGAAMWFFVRIHTPDDDVEEGKLTASLRSCSTA